MFDTGWHTPGTVPTVGYLDSDNIKLEDGNYAYIHYYGPGTPIIPLCSPANNFNLNIPTNATILGIEVSVVAKKLNESGTYKPLYSTQLYYNGGVLGGSITCNDEAAVTDTIVTTGSNIELWGATLTPAIVNDSSFGVNITTFSTGAVDREYYIDVVEMKVYYDYPCTTSIVETIDLNVVNDNYDTGAEISILDGMMNNNIRLIKVLGKNDVAENTCADLKKDALNAYLVPGVGVKDMTGLTNYYDFNETTGSTLYDLHGSNNGTVNGATMNQTGKLGTSYSFDGNDYVNLGSIALDNKTFSISMWFANTRTAGTSYIIGQGVGENNTGLHIGREGTGKFRFAFFSNDLDSSSNVTTDGSWQHWVVTYNASTRARKIYLNGVLNASGTASTNYIGTGDLYIGYAPCLTEYMLGKGDEIALFVNKELSLAEVEQLYNSGAGLKYDNDTYAQEWVNNTNISGETTTTDNATDETIERITSSDEYATFLLSDITGDTKTTCQLYVQQVNNEPGCEIVYDLYSKDGEVDTDIPINKLHEITNFEATTTKLNNGKIRIHLKNDALVPTSGYPSIKGYAIKFW